MRVVSGVEARMLIESNRVLLPGLVSKDEVDGDVFPVIVVPCKHISIDNDVTQHIFFYFPLTEPSLSNYPLMLASMLHKSIIELTLVKVSNFGPILFSTQFLKACHIE